MRRLLLLRHAKAEPLATSPASDDLARILTPRGRENAAVIGHFIKAQHLIPDRTLVSTAQRTRETFAQAAAAWSEKKDAPAPVTFDPRIYDASPAMLLDIVTHADDEKDSESVLVIGHNPSIADLAGLLIAAGDASAMARFNVDDSPTAALAVIDFSCHSWREIAPDSGWLRLYVTPFLLASDEIWRQRPRADMMDVKQDK